MIRRCVAGFLAVGAACSGRPDDDVRATFIGSTVCAECHTSEFESWQASQHAVAMQDATPRTVLGRFDTRFTHDGVTTTFMRRGDRFMVNTQGADGRAGEFEIRYTFGVYPLQQYLVEFSRGRIQPLLVAWDARPDSVGGQRWFAVDSATMSGHVDEFHWTGREQNWNYMCADCHSTGVRKGYVATTDSFRTTHSEISVGCEACHGPGSLHAEWGKSSSLFRRLLWRDPRIPARLGERSGVRWSIDSATGNASRSVARTTDGEIEVCAQCHARRVHFADGYTAGAPLLDYYLPLVMASDLYYADGQQRDEVYTYGSFLQSRMYSAGVTCADCHEPHGQKLRRPGNQVCAQCHQESKYDRESHHHHAEGSAGAQCVSCHMPAATYMRVDPRRDHSLRIPRPDLTVAMGVPNACNGCHLDRDAAWAAGQIRAWFPIPQSGFQRFATAFAADDRGDSTAVDSLASVANDASEPWFVRASALSRLSAHIGPQSFDAARFWSSDHNGQVRHAALSILEALPPAQRIPLAGPALGDPVRAVRQQAAWLLSPVADSLAPDRRRAFDVAAAEFVESQRYNADRAPNRILLGAYYANRGWLDSAAVEFRAAIGFAPHSAQGYLLLAEVFRARGQRDEAEAVLRSGFAAIPDDESLRRALARIRGQD